MRLPAAFRFDGANDVYVRRDAITGDVILSLSPPNDPWTEFFEAKNQANVTGDLMSERPLNEPMRRVGLFEKN